MAIHLLLVDISIALTITSAMGGIKSWQELHEYSSCSSSACPYSSDPEHNESKWNSQLTNVYAGFGSLIVIAH